MESKKFSWIIVAIVMVSVSFGYAAEKKMYAKTNCNIRAGPGLNYGIVGKLQKGEKVYVVETVYRWHQIRKSPGGKEIGWVYSNLLVGKRPEIGKKPEFHRINHFTYDGDNDYYVGILRYVSNVPSPISEQVESLTGRKYRGMLLGLVHAFESCHVFLNFQLQQARYLYDPNSFVGELVNLEKSGAMGQLRPGTSIKWMMLVPEQIDPNKPIIFWAGDDMKKEFLLKNISVNLK